MEFNAAVLHAVDQPLVVERVRAVELGPNDVLVRMGASGLCHSDLEVIQGSLKRPMPIILGHEGAGVVERIGSGVTRVKPGDHVVCSWNPNCGHCFYCERGTPILCEPLSATQHLGNLIDGRSRYELTDGSRLNHFSLVSSHAEYCVVSQAGAVKVSPDIPFDVACLIGCGVMTGVGAVVRLAKVEPGASIAVIGIGAVGLNALQGGLIANAGSIIAIDRDPKKLLMAKEFGASATVDASDPDVIARVKALTAGRGVDYVFECAGHESAVQLSLEIARPGAQVVILGKTAVNEKVGLRFGSIMGEKRVIRSSYGGARPQRDFPWLAQMYLDGKLKLDPLVSSRIPLSDIIDPASMNLNQAA